MSAWRWDGNLKLNGAELWAGTGDPEGVITAPIGSIYLRKDGTATTVLYVKAGTGNSGWSQVVSESGVGPVTEADLTFSDITTGDASTVKHGLLKKLPNDATIFLSGAGTFISVAEALLTLTDITTNNVTTSKHGFVPKAPNDILKTLDGTGAWSRAGLGINTQTGDYALVLTDAGKIVRMNVGSSNNLTVPGNATVAFPIGTQISIRQTGAGATTIVAAGATSINTSSSLDMVGQNSTIVLVKVATDEWDLIGETQ